jgi:ATP-dependent DNA ligase
MTRLCGACPLTNFSHVVTLSLGSPFRLHRTLPPSPADRAPSGPDWIHEIKHDGYRLMARRDPDGIRLLTRNGYDWTPRYPLIVEAVDRLKVRSCLIDGEAVASQMQLIADLGEKVICPAELKVLDLRGST